MNHFSITALSTRAFEMFRRFPLPFLFALAATVSMIFVVHEDPQGNELLLVGRLAMTFYLSMLLAIAVSLFVERFVVQSSKKLLIWSASLALMVFYFVSLPSVMDGGTMARFALLTVALHLLVAFAPIVLLREMNGLWQYNKTLFIRILIGGVYSGVLFAGLALAIAAVDNLFEVQVDEKFYAYLWLTIAGVFNTGFFLAGVPENISALERTADYPKGLKIFTLYVLIPLITVYLVILYAYAGKILITSDWPVGWVANLVIAFSIFGILSFLLVYPLRDDTENPWVSFYSRLFYFLLVPLIGLLYVSIFKRIDMYGVTVERYLVVLLAVWLTFIAVFFIPAGGKRIWVIPLSLCVIVVLSTFGPWGAFAVSRESQIDELTVLLNENQLLVNGKIDSSKTHEVQAVDYDRIQSIVNYVGEMHGHRSLQGYFDQNIDSIIYNESNVHPNYLAIFDLMKLVRIESEDGSPTYLSYGKKDRVMLSSEGYSFVTEFFSPGYESDSDSTVEFVLEADTVRLKYSESMASYTLSFRDLEPLVLDMKELYASLPNHGDMELSPERLSIVAANSQWRAKLVFRSLGISREQGESILKESGGSLMLGFGSEVDQLKGHRSK